KTMFRLGTAGCVCLLACSSQDQPHALPEAHLGGSGGSGGIDFDAGTGGPPPADADAYGIGGNEGHPIIVAAPHLYVVFDASGSMNAPANDGTGDSRYDAVRIAAVNLVRTLGPLVNVGAAVFPRKASQSDSCHVGEEVFPVAPGDPITGDEG